ncbi:MAG: hypothetical protein IJA96_01620 [Alistipes sp.]|nr:hypothetical protein [Alistipes sp.]
MKKLILSLMLIGCVTITNAQPMYKVYCSIIGNEKELQNGVVDVTIDYGQEILRKNYFVDENGDKIQFRTMISAMNYMSKLGWNLEETYHSTDKIMGSLITVWILSKHVCDDSEITQGFQTRFMYEQQQ